MCQIRVGGGCKRVGGGDCLKDLKPGGSKKREGKTKILKKEGVVG